MHVNGGATSFVLLLDLHDLLVGSSA